MKTPEVVNGSLRTAFSLMYLAYACWGIAVFFQGLKTVNIFAGTGGELIWALGVALASLGAAFYTYKGSTLAERIAVAIWFVPVVLYPLWIIIRLISLDWEILPQLFVATGYLILPTWQFFNPKKLGRPKVAKS